MRIAVTGSIATDHLMVFPGKFSEQFVVDQLDKVSLSFLVDQLEVRRGGVAANICFGLGSLGMNPILVGAVGADFDEYRAWLERHGVDTKSVHVSRTKHTSRFLCTTDQVQAQIATFYAGAMEEARDIELRPIADRVGGLDPGDRGTQRPAGDGAAHRGVPRTGYPVRRRPVATVGAYGRSRDPHARGRRGLPVHQRVRDVAVAEGDGLVGVGGARPDRVLGEDLRPRGRADRVEGHRAVGGPRRQGDRRGGSDRGRRRLPCRVLWGLHAKLSLERSAQVGCTLAAIVLETVGTQEYTLDRAEFSKRVAVTYGGDAAAEIESKLRV